MTGIENNQRKFKAWLISLKKRIKIREHKKNIKI